jgi:hypothetical protein
MVTRISIAVWATVKMLLRFVLALLKRLFMLLLPLWRPALKTLREYIRSPVRTISQVVSSTAHKASQDAGALAKSMYKTFLFVCGRLYKAGFVPIVADITVKRKLESRVGRVVLVVSGKCLQHRLIPSYISINLFTARGTFYNVKKLKIAASRVGAVYHQSGSATITPFSCECLPSAGWARYKK